MFFLLKKIKKCSRYTTGSISVHSYIKIYEEQFVRKKHCINHRFHTTEHPSRLSYLK